MTDCSSTQGSTTSSSSDVVTTTTSSWCAITPNTRIRVVRLVRPHSRRILVTPDNNASFGFSIRGGKEFGTGFFVSSVERNSEADLKGVRVGDQIIRVNGYRVDDAVHKELTQFVSSQDRLTVKLRGVGMLPLKENQCDPLTWHVVKSPGNFGLENAYRSAVERNKRGSLKDIQIVLEVAPRTKLGLGICKGPEWKPGIFVQFTKEKSVARESGLRPGDQILSVNSIDFSDVLFSEAVVVMKSSSTLDMVVRTGSGLDLFPGESSGYNSSASSVTGDQSPCWADASAKRLTSVREEPSTSKSANDRMNLDRRKGSAIVSTISSPNEMNKTIIKLSESGTSINNTMIQCGRQQKPNTTKASFGDQCKGFSPSSAIVVPPPPPPTKATNYVKIKDQDNDGSVGGSAAVGSSKLADICFVSRQSEIKTVIVEVHRSASDDNKQQKATVSLSSLDHHRASSPNKFNGGGDHKSVHIAPAKSIYGKNTSTTAPSAVNNGTYCKSKTAPGGSSSLSSAITEELKKRKEKRQSDDAISKSYHTYSNTSPMMMMEHEADLYSPLNRKPVASKELSSSSPSSSSSSSSSSTATFRQQTEQQQKRIGTSPSCGTGMNSTTDAIAANDQHSALMNEFKRAHQRMFKNGFQESDCKQERKEALKNTAMMSDEVDHRSSNSCNSNGTNNADNNAVHEYNGGRNQDQLTHIPPPPPQFANKNQSWHSASPSAYNAKSLQRSSPPSSIATQCKPPNSPVPDYDNTVMAQPSHLTMPRHMINQGRNYRKSLISVDSKNSYSQDKVVLKADETTKSTSVIPIPPPPMLANHYQHHMHVPDQSSASRPNRPGSITIREYASSQINRKEPSKFDFIASQKNSESRPTQASDSLRTELQKTLSRSNLRKQNADARQDHINNNHKDSAGAVGIIQKAQSPNIEKLTKLLQSQQMQSGLANGSATLNNRPNRSTVTISNSKNELRKTESMPITPPAEYAIVSSGILKNGNSHSHSARNSNVAEKSISFGN